jgi:hypothetical protein
LRPEVVVAAALVELYQDEAYTPAIEAGDTEARDALVYLTILRLTDEFEALRAEVEKSTGFTKPTAARVIEDRREQRRLEEIYGGPDWFTKREKAESDLRRRAGQKAAKRSAA